MNETEYTGNGTAGREADVKPTGFFFQMPKREWVGLTDEDVKSIVFVERSWADAVRKVEAKLKEKNAPDL